MVHCREMPHPYAGVAMQIAVAVHPKENAANHGSETPTQCRCWAKGMYNVRTGIQSVARRFDERGAHFPPLVSIQPSLVHLVDLAPLTG
jgi:hypothetical protein